MERSLINHPKLSVRQRTGTEGPRHDPYHYDEYTITTPNGTLVVHDGLMTYAEFNGIKHQSSGNGNWYDSYVQLLTGYTIIQLKRFGERAKSRCPMGGYHETYSVSGYPGESFEMCSKCAKVTDSYFCESAVM